MEIKRIKVLALYRTQVLTAATATERLGVSTRHFWRLWARYQTEGDGGMAHRNRHQPSPRRSPPELRAKVLALARGPYAGFNDVHFTEKLREAEDLHVSREIVRVWLRGAGLGPKNRRRSLRPVYI
jgi:transposase